MRKAARRFVSSITITCLVIASLFGFVAVAATASASTRAASVASAATGRGALAGARVTPMRSHGHWKKNGWAHRSHVPATKTAAYHLWARTQGHHHASSVTSRVSKADMAKATKTMKAAATAKAAVTPFTAAPSPDNSFEGLDSNLNPLDPNNFGDNWAPNPSADVSPDYYVQTVDFSVGVFDKSTGNLLGAQELEDLFSNGGTTTSGTSCDYDVDDSLLQSANVLYDSQTDRWIVAASEWSDPNFETGPQYECIAVSTTGDPLGAWNVYPIQLVGSGNVEIDAQDIGLWRDGLYLMADRSCNIDTTVPPCPAGTVLTTGSPTNTDLEGDLSSEAFAFNKADLESGSALRWQTTTGIANTCTGNNIGKCGTMDAQELYGWLTATDQLQTGMPPAGTPEYFMTQDDNVNDITSTQYQNFVRWTVDWNTPANSLIVGGNKVLSASRTGSTVTINFSAADNYVAGDSFVIEAVANNINSGTTAAGAGICSNAVIVTTTQLTCTESGSQTVGLTTPGAGAGDVRLALQPAVNYAYHYSPNHAGDYQEPSPGNDIFGNYNQGQPHLRYVNFGGTEQLWWGEATNAACNISSGSSCDSVANSARASWFRVDINSATRAVTVGASSYFQNAESSASISVDRFDPSVALDQNGDLMMGYQVVEGRSGSTAVFPGVRYAGRLSTDPIGAAGLDSNTAQTERSLQEGSTYLVGVDDSAAVIDEFGSNTLMSLDPDGCHFWLTGEYLKSGTNGGTNNSPPLTSADDTYNTRIGEMHYPSCTPNTLATTLTTSGVSGSPGILTATLTSNLTGSGVTNKTISFKLDNVSVGTAQTDDNGVATLTGVDTTGDSPGNNPGAVTASFTAQGEYAAANATGDLNKNTDQTITFPSLSSMTIGGAAQALSATASPSGNTVTYTASPANRCLISGGGTTVSVAGGPGGPATGPGDQGTCTVTANQAGDITYNPAPPVSQSFQVVGQPQTINTPLAAWATTNQQVGVAFTASATASSGLTVGFTTDGVNCDVTGGQVGQNITPSHVGTCNVNVTQIGNDTFAPVTLVAPVPVTITAPQTCAFPSGMSAASSVAVGASINTAITCTPSGLNATTFTVTGGGQTVGTIAASTASTIGPVAASINIQPSQSFAITAGLNGGSGSSRTEQVTCGSCGGGVNIVVGNTVTISGNATSNYNRTAVVTATSASAITVGSGSTNVGTWTAGGTPTIAIVGASETGTTATINTTAAHGLLTGAAIVVAGVTPGGYNGAWTIASTPLGQGAAQATAATLTYSTSPTSSLGNSTVAGTVTPAGSGATESGNTVTLTTTAAHGIGVGVNIHVRNVGVAGYNGDFLTLAGTTGSTILYTVGGPANSLAASGGGTVATAATGASENGTTVTLNTTAAHGLGTGVTILVSGVGVAGFNGTYVTEAPTSGTTITYEDVANTGLNSSGAGSVANTAIPACSTGGTPGAETVSGLHVGTCIVTATQAGNIDYSPAPNVSKTFPVTIGSQTIGFSPTTTQTAPSFVETATLSPALAGTYGLLPGTITSTTLGVCTVGATSNGTGTSIVTVTPVTTGTCTLSAAGNAGNTDFNSRAATSSPNISIAKANQTITFGALANKTFGDADFGVSATASSGLPVTQFSSNTPTKCTVSGSTVHIVAGGLCTIQADQSGNGLYNAAPSVTQSFTINKANQSITFGPLGDKTATDPDFAVSATASSSLAVSFTALGNCTVTADGTDVHITGVGSCSITAHQAGDGNYNAATDVTQSFNIVAAGQTITFNPLANKTFGDANFAVTATASSNLAVNFTAVGQCTVTPDGSVVHITAAGSCTITAHQGGDMSYAAAPDVTQSFTINKENQTITGFAAIPNHTYGDVPFNVSASATSGLTVSFTATGNCTVTLVGHVVITAGGSCTVTAHQSGNGNYNAAPDVAQTFSIAAHATTTGLVLKPSATRHQGATVKFVVTAKAPPGSLKPAGVTINIKIDNIVVASATTNAQGKVTISYTVTQSVGFHNVQAVLVGTPSFATSASASLALHVT